MTKPRNFPARKLKRQIDAAKRFAGTAGEPYTIAEQERLEAARNIRTKKDRASR